MKSSRTLLGGYVLFAALGLVDLGLTCYLLRVSGGHIYESNPVAQWWLARWGWAGLAAFKLTLLALATGAIALVARYRPRAAAHVLTFSCVTTLAIVLYSCTVLRSIPWHAGIYPLHDEAAMAAESRWLDEQIRAANAYRRVLYQAAEEFLAGRSTLDQAVARLSATKRGSDPAWLSKLREVYPGRSDAQCLAATFMDHVRALEKDKPTEQGTHETLGRPRLAPLSVSQSGRDGGPGRLSRQRAAESLVAGPLFGAPAVRN